METRLVMFDDQAAMSGYETRVETHDGVRYIVAPCVLMVEGVRDGGQGPLLYTGEELSMFPGAWNGSPLTAYHPRQDGQPVSANAPEVLELWRIGYLFNVYYDPEILGLRGEAWVDIERCSRVHPQTLRAIQAGEPLENSTGLWCESDGVGGVHDGREYEGRAMNIRPDHHALLWGGTGACSLEDGCGVRANEEGNQKMETMTPEEKGLLQFMRKFVGMAEEPSKQEQFEAGYETPCLCTNAMEMTDAVRQLQRLADELDRDVPGGMLLHYVKAAFTDGTLIMRVVNTANGEEQLFRMTYVTEEEAPTALGDEMVEVRLQQEFVPVTNDGEDGDPPEDDTEPETHEEEDMEMSKEKKVDALIGHEKTSWTEENRDALMSFSEEQLDGMVPAEEKPEPEPEANAQPEPQPEPDNKPDDAPETMEDYLAKAPEGMREVLQHGLDMHKAKRTELVARITAHEGNKFTEDRLNAMSIGDLEAMAALIPTPHVYAGAGGGAQPDLSGDQPEEGLATPNTNSFFQPEEKAKEAK